MFLRFTSPAQSTAFLMQGNLDTSDYLKIKLVYWEDCAKTTYIGVHLLAVDRL